MPGVSIIVPCYDQAVYLPDALDSVLAQQYTDWECIVVNDGSSDNTEEIALAYNAKDSRIKYLYMKHSGVSAARNSGIEKALGEYILPLDADDKIGPFYIAEAIDIFKKNPTVKLVYSEAEYFGKITGKWLLPDYSIEELLRRNLIFCSAIFKKEDYMLTSGYDEKLIYGVEDWDLWLSLLKTGGDVVKIEKIHFFYRIKDNSRNTNICNDKEMYSSARKIIFQKHIDLYYKYIYVQADPISVYFENKSLRRNLDDLQNSKCVKLYNMLKNIIAYLKTSLFVL